MSRKALLLALVAGFTVVLALAASRTGFAAEEKKTVKLTGEVEATYDDDGNLTAAKLTVGKDVYSITLDAKGKKCAEEMDCKKAEITCTVTEKDKAKWIAVESYKEIEEPGEDK